MRSCLKGLGSRNVVLRTTALLDVGFCMGSRDLQYHYQKIGSGIGFFWGGLPDPHINIMLLVTMMRTEG